MKVWLITETNGTNRLVSILGVCSSKDRAEAAAEFFTRFKNISCAISSYEMNGVLDKAKQCADEVLKTMKAIDTFLERMKEFEKEDPE